MKRLAQNRPPLEIEITKEVGVALSEAKVVEHGDSKVQIDLGELFEVDKWVVPVESMLRVYVPNAAPEATVYRTATEISKLKSDDKIHWLDDPTAGRPTHVMNWNGKTWELDAQPARIEIKDANGKVLHVQSSPIPPPVYLGALPTAEDVRKHLPDGSTLLLLLPPTDVIADKLGVLIRGLGKAIDAVRSPQGAHYCLEGRAVPGNVEYSWVIPDSTEDDVRADKDFQLPLRSDSIPSQGELPESTARAVSQIMDKAQRIGRLRAWLVLPNPPGQTKAFPYQLTFRELGTDHYVSSGDLREGNKYKLYLQANPADLKRGLSPRWVYIFAIDHFGKGTLIFPALGRGNEGNQFPPKGEPGAALPLLIGINGEQVEEDFEIGPPFGIDTYLMLTTEQVIGNPEIFEFDGPRSKGGTRGSGSQNPLEALLSDVGTGSRGPKVPIPSDWNIQRLTLRSVPAK